MSDSVFTHWRDVLLRLQAAEEEIRKTQSYTQEVEMIRLLQELIKEQSQDENTDSAAS
jgi:hypothetical protein